MPIANLRRLAVLAAVTLSLAGCGHFTRKSAFDTEGLRPPESACLVEPSRIGLAEKIRNIDEGNGCVVPNAWKVQTLGSVAFDRSATLNCGMAEPLKDWLEDVVQPTAQRSFGESVISIDVASSYACRPRNNEWGAKMSEHGFGNAIDVAAFTLESGRRVSVADGWRGGQDERRFLRIVHDDACGAFNTVLGPEADSHHRDHIHLDLQNRASSKIYCR